MDFTYKNALEHREDMALLYQEYNELLLRTDPDFEACLAMQNFEREIEDLPVKYAPPQSMLLIVYEGDVPAACAGIKYFDPGICELKRMYVRPAFRNRGLGRQLCELMFQEAQQRGYEKMYLDTMPGLASAVRMYRGFGFYEIAKYYPNPVENVIYLCYDL